VKIENWRALVGFVRSFYTFTLSVLASLRAGWTCSQA